MKKQILNLGSALNRVQQRQINGGNDDCGGCIAWADSRDNGKDRQLVKWSADLESCRAKSSACN